MGPAARSACWPKVPPPLPDPLTPRHRHTKNQVHLLSELLSQPGMMSAMLGTRPRDGANGQREGQRFVKPAHIPEKEILVLSQ